MQIIANPDNEGVIFSVENGVHNQNKTTIKIKSNIGTSIAARVKEPNHISVRKEMDRGRLLFYVKFEGSTAYLDVDGLKDILGIRDIEF